MQKGTMTRSARKLSPPQKLSSICVWTTDQTRWSRRAGIAKAAPLLQAVPSISDGGWLRLKSQMQKTKHRSNSNQDGS